MHEIRDVLAGTASVGRRVVVVAQDDHMPPLAVADHLATRGHEVTVVYPTTAPAPLLGRYILGGILGRLSERGVQLRLMEQVARIDAGSVTTRNVYSGRQQEIDGIDSVVLACGSQSDSALYERAAGAASGHARARRRVRAAPAGLRHQAGLRTGPRARVLSRLRPASRRARSFQAVGAPRPWPAASAASASSSATTSSMMSMPRKASRTSVFSIASVATPEYATRPCSRTYT